MSLHPRRVFCLATVLCGLALPPAASGSWTVAAQTAGSPSAVVETIALTLDHLRDELPDEEFELRYVDGKELTESVLTKKSAFFITDSATFFALGKTGGAWALAMMKNPLASDTSHTTAAAFVVRASRTDLQSLASLQGKAAVAVEPDAFESYRIGMAELRRVFGDQPVFSRETFTHAPVERVVHEIAAGRGDVGIVDACLLEQMEETGAIPKGLLRVVGEKHSSDLRCRHSTELYPGWVFGVALPREALSEEQSLSVRKISEKLFTVPRLASSMQWATPSDTSELRALFEALGRIPREEVTWKLVWRQYGHWFFLFMAVIAALLAHHIYVNRLVRLRTAELTEALERQKKLENDVAREKERFNAMERAGVAGQMSSMIAHELQQPLGSIANYARGIRIRLDERTLEEGALRNAVEKIAAQSELAAGIVKKVRGYVKHPAPAHRLCDLGDILRDSVRRFEISHPGAAPITVEAGGPLPVEGDPLELQLLIFNLLKNADESCRAVPAPAIAAKAFRSGGAELSVTDNGPEVPDERLERFFVPLQSTKADGLGLGLAICQRIAEAHGGRLSVAKDRERCLCVTLRLPLAKEGSDGIPV